MVYLWLEYKSKKDQLQAHPHTESQGNVNTYLGGAIAVTVVGVRVLDRNIMCSEAQGVIVVVLLVMYKRIKLVVALFREASKVAAAMPSIFLTPLTVRVCVMMVRDVTRTDVCRDAGAVYIHPGHLHLPQLGIHDQQGRPRVR